MADQMEPAGEMILVPPPIPQPPPAVVPAWKQAVLDLIASEEYLATKAGAAAAIASIAAESPMNALLVQLSSLLNVMHNLETEASR